jgi:hypothetical protein
MDGYKRNRISSSSESCRKSQIRQKAKLSCRLVTYVLRPTSRIQLQPFLNNVTDTERRYSWGWNDAIEDESSLCHQTNADTDTDASYVLRNRIL